MSTRYFYYKDLVRSFYVSFITARIRRMTGGYIFTSCVSPHPDGRGGPRSRQGGGGVPDPAMDGGVPGLRFSRGVPGLRFSGGGVPVSIKGKFFDTRFGLIHVQTGKKIFVEGPPPPPVKGKIFDTRFGLMHVQTWKKNFLSRDPPPPLPPSKGKNFLTPDLA